MFIPVQHVILAIPTVKTDIGGMLKLVLTILIPIMLMVVLKAQNDQGLQQGKVSFITSQNVYVKFDRTEVIQIGDTLLTQRNEVLIPCMVVINKSSTSCVCELVEGCEVEKEQNVFYSPPIEKEQSKIASNEQEEEGGQMEQIAADTMPSIKKDEKSPRFREKIRGRISAASYSNFSEKYTDNHRGMMRFSFRGEHLRNSPVSVEAYLNYRQNYTIRSDKTMSSEDDFRVYNLAVMYDLDSSLQLTLGRKINYKASSLGAIDGLQADKQFGKFFVGGIAGFRPDLYDHGFNSDQFAYGVYTGFESRKPKWFSTTTMGLLEQQNKGQTDRRFLYFQHSSSIGRNVYLFGSMEMDLYAKIHGESMMKARLTNLYVSARYRFSRILDLTLSYDARRNVIFYETLQTEIERLLEDEARQGARARINFRPIKYLSSGISYSKRFQADQQNESNNINGYISHSKLPFISGRLSLRYNWNQSRYLESRIMSVNYSRPIIKRKLDIDLYFRNVVYQQRTSENTFDQQYIGGGLNYNIGRSWMMSVLYEISQRQDQRQDRLNSRIIFRF